MSRPERINANRFARYFTRTGWVHALLLMAAWLFVFPFIWMFLSSVKTDEELIEDSMAPEVMRFRPVSPYVRPEITPAKPADVAHQRWTQMLPELSRIADAAIKQHQQSHEPVASLDPFDADLHRKSATASLMNSAVAKIDRRLWTGADQPLIDEFTHLLDERARTDALSASLGRIDLLTFQMRTLDIHIFNLTVGADFASNWKVESGNAALIKSGDRTRLSYHFDSPSDPPIVLRYDFHFPPGVRPENLHKLSFSVVADNSWHRVTAALDVDGRRWESDECIYLAQYRPMSLLFQPWTFEDEVMRAKIWTTLKETGKSPEQLGSTTDEGLPAVARITIAPSSTFRANAGKIGLNFDRAFKSVPFWKYIGNSLILVILCTAGSLFSASFVAYAFARLHWPGKSIAFLLLLATMMLPEQVTMIPTFMIWRSVHWYNTLNPLWVPSFFGSAFFIFLMTQHMRTIPRELEEAAKLDGLNALQSWYYIILPQVKPTLAAIAILSFIGAWNEFMKPLIYLRDQSRFPLSLGLYGLGLMRTLSPVDYSWSVIMAGNLMMTIPVIVVFFLFQRYFVQGMALTGMKG